MSGYCAANYGGPMSADAQFFAHPQNPVQQNVGTNNGLLDFSANRTVSNYHSSHTDNYGGISGTYTSLGSSSYPAIGSYYADQYVGATSTSESYKQGSFFPPAQSFVPGTVNVQPTDYVQEVNKIGNYPLDVAMQSAFSGGSHDFGPSAPFSNHPSIYHSFTKKGSTNDINVHTGLSYNHPVSVLLRHRPFTRFDVVREDAAMRKITLTSYIDGKVFEFQGSSNSVAKKGLAVRILDHLVKEGSIPNELRLNASKLASRPPVEVLYSLEKNIVYVEQHGMPYSAFRWKIVYKVREKVFEGFGHTKMDARNMAAMKALVALHNHTFPDADLSDGQSFIPLGSLTEESRTIIRPPSNEQKLKSASSAGVVILHSRRDSLASKHPLMALNDLLRDVHYVYTKDSSENACECKTVIDGKVFTDKGKTKKEAKVTLAKRVLLEVFGIVSTWVPPIVIPQLQKEPKQTVAKNVNDSSKHPVTWLQEYYPSIAYEFGEFLCVSTNSTRYYCSVTLLDDVFSAVASSKRDAKQQVAEKVRQKLLEKDPECLHSFRNRVQSLNEEKC